MQEKKLTKSKYWMYFGASQNIQDKTRFLRKNETEAETLLWEKLKNRKILGFKFRRQHPIDIFIADFYCHERKIVIELDGEIHKDFENKDYDKRRTCELEQLGIKVIRFSNAEIRENINKALKRLREFIESLETK